MAHLQPRYDGQAGQSSAVNQLGWLGLSWLSCQPGKMERVVMAKMSPRLDGKAGHVSAVT